MYSFAEVMEMSNQEVVDLVKKYSQLEKPIYTSEEVLEACLDYYKGELTPASVVHKKYLLKNKEGQFVEKTPADMHFRLAAEFTRAELKFNAELDAKAFFKRCFELFDRFSHVVPQGSPMAAVGNPYQIQSLSNCFVVESPKDTMEGIFTTGLELSQIYKRRGGCGVEMSTLRPMGARVNNAALKSSGVPCFSDFFSHITRMTGQAGRSGALMLSTNVEHPDIEYFITMKADSTKVTGANVSVKITDAFMTAVQNNEDFILRWPLDAKIPKVTKTVKAREIWDQIVEQAWKNAEPGILFWDNIIKSLPAHNYPSYGTTCTNPCFAGESKLLTLNGYNTLEDLWSQSGQLIYGDPRIIESEMEVINTKGITKATVVYKTSESAPMFELTLQNGQKVKATENHAFFKKNEKGELEKVQLKDLLVGDTLPLGTDSADYISGSFDYPEYALLAGWTIGDGSVSKDDGVHTAHIRMWNNDIEDCGSILQDAVRYVYLKSTLSSKQNLRIERPEGKEQNGFDYERSTIKSSVLGRLLKDDNIVPGTKHAIPNSIWRGNARTISAFLKGLFSADGSVQCNEDKSTISIRLAQSSSTNPQLLEDTQLLLNMLGIKSSVHFRRPAGKKVMNDGKGGTKEYDVKPQYELIISGLKYCTSFMENVGFIQEVKNAKARNWFIKHLGSANSDVPLDSKIVSIEYVGDEPSYCLTEHKNNEVIVNGIVTSQCGEIPLSPYDSCRLISMNLLGYMKNAFTSTAEFDFEKYHDDVKFAQRLSDNLVELELEAVEKIRSVADTETEKELWDKVHAAGKNGRRTGLGTHALADIFLAVGVRYDSEEALALTDKVYDTHKLASYESSVELAQERGTFPIWDFETDMKSEFIQKLPEWLRNKIEKYGRRNIANTTLAPTGSVAIASETSSGCEPVFRFAYDRRVKIVGTDNKLSVDFVDAVGDKWSLFRVVHPAVKAYFDANKLESPIKNAKDFSVPSEDIDKALTKALPEWFVTSEKIDYMMGVKLQATIQKHIDHSISKTINMPKGTKKEEVDSVYFEAWKLGLKGVTIYVDGSRDGVLVTSSSKEKKVDEDTRPETITEAHSPKRPKNLPAEIHHVKVKGENWAVVVGLMQGKPFEIFAGRGLTIPKATKVYEAFVMRKGSKAYALSMLIKDNGVEEISDIREIYDNPEQRVITRSVCMELRHGVPVEFIIRNLQDCEGSMVDYTAVLARVLKKYVSKPSLLQKACPECGGTDFIMVESCSQCNTCQYSKCS